MLDIQVGEVVNLSDLESSFVWTLIELRPCISVMNGMSSDIAPVNSSGLLNTTRHYCYDF